MSSTLYSAAPTLSAAWPLYSASRLSEYILTVQLFSYEDLIGTSSKIASEFECEGGFAFNMSLVMPALWGEGQAPNYLVGQNDWTDEQANEWDLDRLRCVVLATRASDMQPMVLYDGKQDHGDINETYFDTTLLPGCPVMMHEEDEQIHLDLQPWLLDEQGVIQLDLSGYGRHGDEIALSLGALAWYFDAVVIWK
jgi:hypothetical protein